MTMRQIFPLAIMAIAAFVYATGQMKFRRACRAAAAKIHGQLDDLYNSDHRYQVLTPAARPPVDLAGYEQVGKALVAAGFRNVGAFENLTVSRIYPENRTFTDAYAGSDGTTRAVTFRIKTFQVTNVMATTTSGTLVVTSNAPSTGMSTPPGVDLMMLPAGTPVADLLARHADHLKAYASKNASATWVPCTTLDDVIDQDRRHARRVADYRRGNGLLTEKEIIAMAGGRAEKQATARRVWKEFCRIRDHRKTA